MKTEQTYWYKFLEEECVLCGRTEKHKERVYDRPKPEDFDEIHEYKQTACDEHFM